MRQKEHRQFPPYQSQSSTTRGFDASSPFSQLNTSILIDQPLIEGAQSTPNASTASRNVFQVYVPKSRPASDELQYDAFGKLHLRYARAVLLIRI